MSRAFRERGFSAGDGFAGLAIGILIGLVLALLFAPKSGAETRKDLANTLTNSREEVGKRLAQGSTCARTRCTGLRSIITAAFRACWAATAERSAELKREAGLP
jgi:gas vesicle protein